MKDSTKRLAVYVAIAALTHFLTSDQVVMLSNMPENVAATHWFTWLLLFLGGLLQILNVIRAFIDKSLGNETNDEIKAELIKLQERYSRLKSDTEFITKPQPTVTPPTT